MGRWCGLNSGLAYAKHTLYHSYFQPLQFFPQPISPGPLLLACFFCPFGSSQKNTNVPPVGQIHGDLGPPSSPFTQVVLRITVYCTENALSWEKEILAGLAPAMCSFLQEHDIYSATLKLSDHVAPRYKNQGQSIFKVSENSKMWDVHKTPSALCRFPDSWPSMDPWLCVLIVWLICLTCAVSQTYGSSSVLLHLPLDHIETTGSHASLTSRVNNFLDFLRSTDSPSKYFIMKILGLKSWGGA